MEAQLPFDDGRRHAFERWGKKKKMTSRDAVCAALVFLHLLEAGTHYATQLSLVHPGQYTARPQASADMRIDIERFAPAFGWRLVTFHLLPDNPPACL